MNLVQAIKNHPGSLGRVGQSLFDVFDWLMLHRLRTPLKYLDLLLDDTFRPLELKHIRGSLIMFKVKARSWQRNFSERG